ncbi:MAG TPA: septum formation initiator family protein [Rhizomicrobium sp.]
MARFFGILVMPAICAAAIVYFGYYTLWGTRGILALTDVRARLSVEEDRLASLKADRDRLEHRIALLRSGSEDPDLVEEIARGQMLGSSPGQIAVPRERR